MGDRKRSQVMTIMIHGDAAFSGEGVVQETLNLSELAVYMTGGSLHIVLNNQIGFTTEAAQGRSTTYATDVAKMLQIRSFTSTVKIPKRLPKWCNWRWISAKSSVAMWSSTCIAIGVGA